MTSPSEEQQERAVNLAVARVNAINQFCGAIAAGHTVACRCVACRVIAGDEGAFDIVAGIADSLGSMQED
jgi:hypothetical protein